MRIGVIDAIDEDHLAVRGEDPLRQRRAIDAEVREQAVLRRHRGEQRPDLLDRDAGGDELVELGTLTAELRSFCDAEGLPWECADELLSHPGLTEAQRQGIVTITINDPSGRMTQLIRACWSRCRARS